MQRHALNHFEPSLLCISAPLGLITLVTFFVWLALWLARWSCFSSCHSFICCTHWPWSHLTKPANYICHVCLLSILYPCGRQEGQYNIVFALLWSNWQCNIKVSDSFVGNRWMVTASKGLAEIGTAVTLDSTHRYNPQFRLPAYQISVNVISFLWTAKSHWHTIKLQEKTDQIISRAPKRWIDVCLMIPKDSILWVSKTVTDSLDWFGSVWRSHWL